MNKQETLGNLYALRAGLSVISETHDRVEAYNKRMEDIEKLKKEKKDTYEFLLRGDDLEYLDSEYCYYQGVLERELSDLREYEVESNYKQAKRQLEELREQQSEIESLQEKAKKLEEEREKIKHYQPNSIKKKIVGWSLGLGFGVVGIIGMIMGALFGDAESLFMWAFVPGVPVILALVFIPANVANQKKEKKKIEENYNARLSENTTALNKIEEEIKRKKARINGLRGSVCKVTRQVKELLSSKLEEINREINSWETALENEKNKLQEDIQKNRTFTEQIIEKYHPILDMREWGNLDLVIYAMETGRVDTIRDAMLQYVDAEKRADRISQAISEASRKISSSIHSGLGYIKSYMNDSFRQIETRFNELDTKVQSSINSSNAQIQKLSNALDSQSKQLAEIASTENMNSALIKKANTTSEKLAEDMRKMRKVTIIKY